MKHCLDQDDKYCALDGAFAGSKNQRCQRWSMLNEVLGEVIVIGVKLMENLLEHLMIP